MDVLAAYAGKKGWVTAKAGRPDVNRAGNAGECARSGRLSARMHGAERTITTARCIVRPALLFFVTNICLAPHAYTP